jgi:hypothetical protein
MDSAREPLQGCAMIFTGLNLAIHPALYLSSLQGAVIFPSLERDIQLKFLWQNLKILFDLSASSAFICFFMSKKRLSEKRHCLKNSNF